MIPFILISTLDNLSFPYYLTTNQTYRKEKKETNVASKRVSAVAFPLFLRKECSRDFSYFSAAKMLAFFSLLF